MSTWRIDCQVQAKYALFPWALEPDEASEPTTVVLIVSLCDWLLDSN